MLAAIQAAMLLANPVPNRMMAQPASPNQQMVLQNVSGQQLTGTIDRIDSSGRLTGTGISAGLNLDSILSIQTGRSIKSVQYRAQVYLVGSSASSVAKVGANKVGIAAEKISLAGQVGKFELPLQTVRAIVWRDSATVQQAIARPSADNDRVIVDVDGTSQTVNGIIEAVTSESVSIIYKGKLQSIGIAKVNAVVLADVGHEPPTGVMASLVTTDGSRFFGTIQTWADDPQKPVVKLSLAKETTVSIETKQVVEVQFQSDRLLYLSKVEPIAVSETTDFVEARSFQRDRSVTGGKLQIRGADDQPIVFSSGIGSQATSELTYANDKKFNRLLATVGIDLATKGRGDCRVVVKTDGIEVFNQQVTAASDPLELNVDIASADRVSLIVLPGREFDLADHVVWGDAKLVNTKDSK